MTRDVQADRLARQATAAKSLIEELRSEDAELNHDMIEGETDLMEAIDSALSEMDECAVIVDGCKSVMDKLSARKEKAEKREKRLRGLIEQAMVIAGLDRARRPTATLTVRKIGPKPIVTDEAMIPAEFWRTPDPVLDRKKIADADTPPPGVTMSNGTTLLTIRRV